MIALALGSLLIWLYLIFAHGKFWRSAPELPPAVAPEHPDVDIIVPARDEAHTIGRSSARCSRRITAAAFGSSMVDDNSTDGTAALAGTAEGLTIITLRSKPAVGPASCGP